MSKRRSGLTSDEKRLWAYVARSARPLPGKKPPPLPIEPKSEAPDESVPTQPLRMLHFQPAPRALPPLVMLDRRTRRDVARGQFDIDARIDLHGMRQAEAHRALLGFLHHAHALRYKLVLVITGKGRVEPEPDRDRGVLRRLVPHWLADPTMRRLVIGYEPAAIGHGGDGALYVRLRKDRTG